MNKMLIIFCFIGDVDNVKLLGNQPGFKHEISRSYRPFFVSVIGICIIQCGN